MYPCPGRPGTLACFEGKAGQEAEKGTEGEEGWAGGAVFHLHG